MQRLTADGPNCPAATLRDKMEIVLEAKTGGWNIYGSYVPGPTGTTFASANLPIKYSLVAGMVVSCEPPFVSAEEGPNNANIAPESIEPLTG
eukprot:4603939-Pleurochrysis_carterae.AAC.1